jgi:hypothetical protein
MNPGKFLPQRHRGSEKGRRGGLKKGMIFLCDFLCDFLVSLIFLFFYLCASVVILSLLYFLIVWRALATAAGLAPVLVEAPRVEGLSVQRRVFFITPLFGRVLGLPVFEIALIGVVAGGSS